MSFAETLHILSIVITSWGKYFWLSEDRLALENLSSNSLESSGHTIPFLRNILLISWLRTLDEFSIQNQSLPISILFISSRAVSFMPNPQINLHLVLLSSDFYPFETFERSPGITKAIQLKSSV